MANDIGTLIGHAETRAAVQGFDMGKTYKARLAKHIKEELDKGTHIQDVRAGVDALIDRRLSPYLLSRKIADLQLGLTPGMGDEPEETDPFTPFPEY